MKKQKLTKELFTARQLQVLLCVSLGDTAPAIGKVLDISVKTVNQHVLDAKKRAGAKTLAQLMYLCGRKKII